MLCYFPRMLAWWCKHSRSFWLCLLWPFPCPHGAQPCLKSHRSFFCVTWESWLLEGNECLAWAFWGFPQVGGRWQWLWKERLSWKCTSSRLLQPGLWAGSTWMCLTLGLALPFVQGGNGQREMPFFPTSLLLHLFLSDVMSSSGFSCLPAFVNITWGGGRQMTLVAAVDWVAPCPTAEWVVGKGTDGWGTSSLWLNWEAYVCCPVEPPSNAEEAGAYCHLLRVPTPGDDRAWAGSHAPSAFKAQPCLPMHNCSRPVGEP